MAEEVCKRMTNRRLGEGRERRRKRYRKMGKKERKIRGYREE